jgi:hypothetical protein
MGAPLVFLIIFNNSNLTAYIHVFLRSIYQAEVHGTAINLYKSDMFYNVNMLLFRSSKFMFFLFLLVSAEHTTFSSPFRGVFYCERPSGEEELERRRKGVTNPASLCPRS